MKKMLIIEDSKVNYELLKLIFGHTFDIDVAENGKEAQHLLLSMQKEYDIIISDIMMPMMNGFEFLEWIKSNELFRNIPVVITSAFQEYENEIKAFDLGAVDVIFKPINTNVMVRRIQNIITMSDAERIRNENKILKENISLKEQLQGIFNGVQCGIFRLKTPIDHSYAKTTLIFANDFFYKIRGIARDNYEGSSFLSGVGKMLPSDELMKIIHQFEDTIKDEKDSMNFDTRIIRNTGEQRELNILVGIKTESDSYIFDVIENDITEQRKTEERLYLERELMNTNNKVFANYIKETIPEKRISVWQYDLKTRTSQFIFDSRAHHAIGAVTKNMIETVVKNSEVHPDDIEQFINMHHELESGKKNVGCNLRVNLTGKEDTTPENYSLVKVTYTTIFDKNNRPVSAIGISEEVEAAKASDRSKKNKIVKEKVDKLSGLFTRDAFIDQAEEWIQKEIAGALLMIDLDNFKTLNANFGYEFGDRVIELTASKMGKSFTEDDILGRIGGDEFCIMVSDTNTRDAVVYRAQSLCDTMNTKYQHLDDEIQVSCSIGIAFQKDNKEGSFDQLHRNAVSALCQAKLEGKNKVKVYED